MLADSSSSTTVAGDATQAAVNVPAQADDVSAPAEQVQQEQGQFDETRYRKIAQEEAAKIAQSFTAKAENRINQRIQEQIQALEMNKSVLGLSDEQVEAAKQKIVMKEMTAPPQTAQANAGDQPEYPNQPQFHPIVAEALGMMEDEQMTIDEGDPEFEKYIKPHFSKATVDRTFVADTTRAIDAKKARLALQKENAAARSPGGAGGGGQPKPKPLTPEEKISKGLTAASWQSQEPPAK
jgi:hypothetical protein